MLKISEKTYKSVVASVSSISLNLNVHIPYKILADFFNPSYVIYLDIFYTESV